MAGELSVEEPAQLPRALDDARLLSGASELTVLRANGRVIYSSNVDPIAIVPNQPGETILRPGDVGRYVLIVSV